MRTAIRAHRPRRLAAVVAAPTQGDPAESLVPLCCRQETAAPGCPHNRDRSCPLPQLSLLPHPHLGLRSRPSPQVRQWSNNPDHLDVHYFSTPNLLALTESRPVFSSSSDTTARSVTLGPFDISGHGHGHGLGQPTLRWSSYLQPAVNRKVMVDSSGHLSAQLCPQVMQLITLLFAPHSLLHRPFVSGYIFYCCKSLSYCC